MTSTQSGNKDDTFEIAAITNLGIGARLRAARQAAGFTIDDLCRLTGLSKGFISKIEREETSPSVRTLIGICSILDINIGSLFEQPETRLRRRHEQPIVSRIAEGELREWLVTPRSLDKVQIIAGRLGPLASTGDDLFTVQCPVEVAYVISGTLHVRFSNETAELHDGDSLTFSGLEPHGWYNPSETEPVELIWTLVPAPWNRSNSAFD